MSQPVAQASAWRETSYGRSPGSGTRCPWIFKVARECGALGNANGGPLRPYSDLRRKGSRTPPRGARLRKLDRGDREYVALESLRRHASAERWRTQGTGCTEPY